MTIKTRNRLVNKLVNDIENHSHRQELIDLMIEQVIDDSGSSPI